MQGLAVGRLGANRWHREPPVHRPVIERAHPMMTSAACCLTAQKRAACGAQRAGCPSEPAPSALHPTTTLLQCLCAHRSAVHPHSQRHMAAAPAPKMCKSSGNTALALPFPRRGSQHSNRAKWRPRTEPWAVPFFRSRRSDPWSRHQHGSCGRSSCVFGAVAHQARRAPAYCS